MKFHEAMYSEYHPAHQTKMSTNVHYIPIRWTYVLFFKYIVYSMYLICMIELLFLLNHSDKLWKHYQGLISSILHIFLSLAWGWAIYHCSKTLTIMIMNTITIVLNLVTIVV